MSETTFYDLDLLEHIEDLMFLNVFDCNGSNDKITTISFILVKKCWEGDEYQVQFWMKLLVNCFLFIAGYCQLRVTITKVSYHKTTLLPGHPWINHEIWQRKA